MTTAPFELTITAWAHGAPIPDQFAFGRPGGAEPFAPSDNRNPALAWSNPPAGTQSFVIICHDDDVPSVGDDVNQADREVPADLPRVPFYHWLLVDIPAGTDGIAEGAVSDGIVARGKPTGDTALGRSGSNDYTGWFAGDPDMAGTYGGYDGPCPPWNDSIIHHYHFTVYAIDIAALPVAGDFTGADVLAAIEGHILAQASHMGTYAMNPRLR